MNVLSRRNVHEYYLDPSVLRPRIDLLLIGAAFFGAASWLGLQLF